MPSIVSVVVHPSRVFREGITRILAKSPFEPACAASRTEDLPSRISGAGEQVLLLIGVGERSNLAEALMATKASFPDAHVVVVGDATKRDNVATAIELGASSFVDENTATSTLVKELELVALGEPVISVFILKRLLGYCSPACDEDATTPALEKRQPSDTQRRVGHCPAPVCDETAAIPAVDESRSPDPQSQAEQRLQLSGREAAILSGLVQGASNKVIAYQLKITEATVKVHVKAILRKIRVRNRTQAAIWALNCQTLPKRLTSDDGGSPATHASLGYGGLGGSMIGPRPTESSSESAAHR
jgi:two-component system, NarL family, nitrate/nitrite response regulator NarL